jgi:hypothetical protein
MAPYKIPNLLSVQVNELKGLGCDEDMEALWAEGVMRQKGAK